MTRRREVQQSWRWRGDRSVRAEPPFTVRKREAPTVAGLSGQGTVGATVPSDGHGLLQVCHPRVPHTGCHAILSPSPTRFTPCGATWLFLVSEKARGRLGPGRAVIHFRVWKRSWLLGGPGRWKQTRRLVHTAGGRQAAEAELSHSWSWTA